MNIWESTVLTDKGAALQAKLMNGQTLHITKVMTGGAKVPVVNLRQQTSVTDGGKKITLQPVRMEKDQIVVPVLLENTGLEESYDLWQVGIYAQDPDEGEILYCLAQATEAKHIPSAAEGPGFSITWDFYFKTSNTVPFEVDLNSKGLVSIEQYQVHEGEINGLKEAVHELDGGIKELNADLVQYSKDILGLRNEEVIKRKTYVGTDLSCNVADGNLYRCSSIAINISELGFRTLSDVKAHFLQTSNNSAVILGVSIYGQATINTVRVLVWTPESKKIDSIAITLECIGTV